MRTMTTLLFSVPFAISILLSSHVAFGNVSGSADVQVDLSFLNLQNLPLTITSITSTSTADGTTDTVSGSGSTSAVATPQFLSLIAITTNSNLKVHSSFDFPLSTVGVSPGYFNLPPGRPLANFGGQSVATTTITFQALQGLGEVGFAVPYTQGGTLVGFEENSNGIRESFQIIRDLQLVISGPGFNKPSSLEGPSFPGGVFNGLAHFQVADYNPGDLGSITLTAITTVGYGERIIPEPSTWLLLGSGLTGLAGLAVWRERSRRKRIIGGILMRPVALLVAVFVALFSLPAYADTTIPISAGWSAGCQGGECGSFTIFSGPGMNGSIQMIAYDYFGGPGGDVTPGQPFTIRQEVGGHASVGTVPCFSEVSCSGANVSFTYQGLTYQTPSFFVSQQSLNTMSIDMEVSGSAVLPIGTTDQRVALNGPAVLTGTATLDQYANGPSGLALVSQTAFTFSGQGTLSVSVSAGGVDGQHYFTNDLPSMSFIGTAVGPPVPEPTTVLLLGSGLAGMILWRKRTA